MQRLFPREEYFSVVSVLFAIKLKIRLKNDEVNERRTKKIKKKEEFMKHERNHDRKKRTLKLCLGEAAYS